jgi:hypothetical protein
MQTTTIELKRKRGLEQLDEEGRIKRARPRAFFQITRDGPPLTAEQVGMCWGARLLSEKKVDFKWDTHPLTTQIVEPLVHGFSVRFGDALSMYAERQLWECLSWAFAAGSGLVNLQELQRPCSALTASDWFWSAFKNAKGLEALAKMSAKDLELCLAKGFVQRQALSGVELSYPGFAIQDVMQIALTLGAARLVAILMRALHVKDGFDGMPDVAVCFEEKLLMVECKTTDLLSSNQKAWIQFLRALDVQSRVLQVKEA